MPHNSILSDSKLKAAVKESVPADIIAENDSIQITKEPDYMFVVNDHRKDVLTDQLEAINNHYCKKRIDPQDPDYGLLDKEPDKSDDE